MKLAESYYAHSNRTHRRVLADHLLDLYDMRHDSGNHLHGLVDNPAYQTLLEENDQHHQDALQRIGSPARRAHQL